MPWLPAKTTTILCIFHLFILWRAGLLPTLSSSSAYEEVGEDREAIRKKEVEDLISKYAKKKDKEEVTKLPLSSFLPSFSFAINQKIYSYLFVLNSYGSLASVHCKKV